MSKLAEIRERDAEGLDTWAKAANDRRELIRRLDVALKALQELGDDYPGSSCQEWCQTKIMELEA